MPHGARKYGFVIVAALLLIPLIWGNVKISFYAIYLFDFIYDVVTNKPDTPKQISYYIHTPDYWLTIQGIFLVLGAMLILFSKEKIEDEYTAKTRLESLLWACRTFPMIIILSYFSSFSLFWLGWLLVFGGYFPIIAYIRFKYILYRTNKLLKDSESLDSGISKPTTMLINRKYSRIGYLLLLISALMYQYVQYFLPHPSVGIPKFALIDYLWDLITFKMLNISNYFGTLSVTTIYIDLFCIGITILILSKVKDDDEYIMQLRLDSFLWAFYANAVFLLSQI